MAPYLALTVLFLIAPLSYLVIGAFEKPDGAFTLDNMAGLAAPNIAAAYWLSIRLSLASAAVGPSGCGKTTVAADGGGVRGALLGRHRHRRHRCYGFAPQPAQDRHDVSVLCPGPNLTVAGNVAFGLKVAGMGRDETLRRVDEMLAMVGLAGYGARYPFQLSGGQQQRVALARAIAARPRVLLLDEASWPSSSAR